MLTPQVKPVETGLFESVPTVVTNSSCCFEEHVSSQKKTEAHKHIFTPSQQQQHIEQRIQSMSSVISLEIVFCQLSPLIIPPKYHCNWHCKSVERGGVGSVQLEETFGVLPVSEVNISNACCSSHRLPAALVSVTKAFNAKRNIYTQTCSYIIKPHRVSQLVF